MKKRVVIIGGGFAGLAAAHRLHRASDDLEALLLESSPRIGGKVMTHRNDMGVFEEGPNAMLSPDGALKDLIDLSGVSLIEADESAKRRYLCRAGRLVEIAPSPWRLLRGGALSLGGTLRMCCEAFVGARKCQHGNHASAQWGDESVHSFLKRRFGLEFADRFAAPMVSGVFAGDPKSLSLQSAFSKLAQLEAEHGSVIKGMKRLRAEGTPAPRLYAPRNGMQSISEAITKRGDFQVRFNSTVTGLRTSEGKWLIDIAGDDSIAAEAIILSTPASAASDLLGELNQGVSTLLAKINSPHLSVINLLYEEPDAAKAPKAFGALHSQDGHSDLLGVLHESHIFPGRRSDGRLHLRVMIGGAMRPEMKAYSDSKLSESAVAELRRLHGFASDPSIMSLKRWNSSIPQYELGHARLISDVSAALKADRPRPIALAGNYLQGVSLSDTASSGRVAAQKILDLLAS